MALWDCPACGAKSIAGETCPTCGSTQPSAPDAAVPISALLAPAAPAATPQKRPWTAGRILYNVLALIGGIALMALLSDSRHRSRRMDSFDVQEDSTGMTLYAIVGGLIVVGVIMLGVVYLASRGQAAQKVTSTQTAALAARP